MIKMLDPRLRGDDWIGVKIKKPADWQVFEFPSWRPYGHGSQRGGGVTNVP